MDDDKPRFFVSHDANGLSLWLSRARPRLKRDSKRFECDDATRMRLPYSWFGHILKENSSVEIDMDLAVTMAQGK